MESLETRIKRLEVIADNLDERVADHDEKRLKIEARIKQMTPILIHAAKNNVFSWLAVILALIAILMQII